MLFVAGAAGGFFLRRSREAPATRPAPRPR
jgi:hypothetical protein